MAFVLADRVQETTTTTGTGTITLAGAVSGFQSFAAIGNSNTTYYTIAHTTLAEWEVGIGTYTSSGTTLSRTTILSSSNSGSAVNFSAGTKNVFCTSPASRSVLESDTGYIFAGLPSTNNGLVPMSYLYRLNSTVVGSNATGAQTLFGVGVTLASNTVYAFEQYFNLTKSAGTTSHNVSTLFGGTATINNIGYSILTAQSSTTGTVSGSPLTTQAYSLYSQQATATQISQSVTTAAHTVYALLKGTVSVNVGGTFIPQYQLSAIPGGAYTAQIGSYCLIYPISASGSNTNIGGWA